MLIADSQVHIWGANTPERPRPKRHAPHREVPLGRRVYDAFGPQRVFWGTDLTRLPCTYRQAVTMFTEDISWLTADDKEWIMGRGVCEWLGWEE
jgi:hypothetical protein